MTLSRLLPQIARYRDDFYERLFNKIGGKHAERIKQEAAERRQPFGGARQHLNAQLARQRASQLEHVHLAKIFARMGHTAPAQHEASVVPCASARMQCHIDCLLTSGQLACDRGQLEDAAHYLPKLSICSNGPSTAARSSIPGTFWASTPSTAYFRPSKTASETTAPTSSLP
jgi:hypothetical protein